jgi:hypothetical protein
MSCLFPVGIDGFLFFRDGVGFRTWAYRVYLSSLLLLFSYNFNFVFGVLAFGGSFGAVNRKGLALLEYARRIRVLAWDVLVFSHWLFAVRLDLQHPSLQHVVYCISVSCLFF